MVPSAPGGRISLGPRGQIRDFEEPHFFYAASHLVRKGSDAALLKQNFAVRDEISLACSEMHIPPCAYRREITSVICVCLSHVLLISFFQGSVLRFCETFFDSFFDSFNVLARESFHVLALVFFTCKATLRARE